MEFTIGVGGDINRLSGGGKVGVLVGVGGSCRTRTEGNFVIGEDDFTIDFEGITSSIAFDWEGDIPVEADAFTCIDLSIIGAIGGIAIEIGTTVDGDITTSADATCGWWCSYGEVLGLGGDCTVFIGDGEDDAIGASGGKDVGAILTAGGGGILKTAKGWTFYLTLEDLLCKGLNHFV